MHRLRHLRQGKAHCLQLLLCKFTCKFSMLPAMSEDLCEGCGICVKARPPRSACPLLAAAGARCLLLPVLSVAVAPLLLVSCHGVHALPILVLLASFTPPLRRSAPLMPS